MENSSGMNHYSDKSKKYKHLIYGNGKGKTSSAIGMAVRAAGAGWNVVFAQFMKGSPTSEIEVLKNIPGIRVIRNHEDFGFFNVMSEEDKLGITLSHNTTLDIIIQEAERKECQMIILDEITSAFRNNLIDREKFIDFLKKCNETELVLTGDLSLEELSVYMDYITETKQIRHPYEKGVMARKGVEF